MKKHKDIRIFVKVKLSPEEFLAAVEHTETVMRREKRRDQGFRLDVLSHYFNYSERGMAFVIRMECMIEMSRTERGLKFPRPKATTGEDVLGDAFFCAAALAPLHFDAENQFFREDEFFEIVEQQNASVPQ